MELIYRLNEPRWTVYHRAALGGLAATIRAWETPPAGIEASCTRQEVRIAWGSELSDREALRRILDASFRIDDGLIDLPGQRLSSARADLRIAVHNAVCMTFLQHPKRRPGPKEPRIVALRDSDDKPVGNLSYKALTSYAHRDAQKTGLLDRDSFPPVAAIPSWMIPGAVEGAGALDASPADAILLLYVMVGAAVFLLRPHAWGDKAKACIVLPEVRDLIAFADAIGALAVAPATPVAARRPHACGDYVGRLVGGVEEAALRFLLDLGVEQAGVEGVHAVAMGKVAWDSHQLNRSMRAHLHSRYEELDVYRVAQQNLGRARVIPTKDGNAFVVPRSAVPELIAANLAANLHWCAAFRDLVRTKEDFRQQLYVTKELNAVKQVIHDANDQAVIAALHEAWHRKQGELGERAREEGADFGRLAEVERERMRNAILRAKTADALAGWFLRFVADATKGAALPAVRDQADRLRAFLFDPRNADRLQNLLLFALVSYAPKAKNETGTPNVERD